MLPTNYFESNSYQSQLELKINELNNLEWRAGEKDLVSESEIKSVIEESLNSLNSCPNSALSSSLLNLTERVKSEEHVGPALKDIANKVQNSLKILENAEAESLSESSTTPIFPVPKELTSKFTEQMGIKSLSKFSQLNHQGNEKGKNAIILRIQQLGYEGNDYDESIIYLKELNAQLNIFLEYTESELFKLPPDFFSTPKFSPETKKTLPQEYSEFILDKLKNISNEDLVNLCAVNLFHSDDFNLNPTCAPKSRLNIAELGK